MTGENFSTLDDTYRKLQCRRQNGLRNSWPGPSTSEWLRARAIHWRVPAPLLSPDPFSPVAGNSRSHRGGVARPRPPFCPPTPARSEKGLGDKRGATATPAARAYARHILESPARSEKESGNKKGAAPGGGRRGSARLRRRWGCGLENVPG